MHFVTYQALLFADQQGRIIYSVWIDVETEKLEFIVTPSVIEQILDE